MNSTKPDKLVLTKAEILAAIQPIQTLVARIAECEDYNYALPDDCASEDYVDEPEIEDADLELYDAIHGIRQDALYPLWSLLFQPLMKEIEARDKAEKAAARARSKAAREANRVVKLAKADPAMRQSILKELAD